ncbi:hypothetical protein JM83_1344 [Gillisia sp. Hel_I_86]|nr:hypothetical protein JM83_1344 [Gillisia sp. Hel_I_86]
MPLTGTALFVASPRPNHDKYHDRDCGLSTAIAYAKFTFFINLERTFKTCT